MKLSRRDVFRVAGGAALGMFFTPLPWKALGDAAKWTQNWPWIPEAPRGPFTERFATCSLCPAACGLRARCVGGIPVGISAVEGHPLSGGALCPMGIVSHHLQYHPARLKQPVLIKGAKQTLLTREESLPMIAAAIKSAGTTTGAVTIVDTRPGRSTSTMLRQLADAIPGGLFVASSQNDDAALPMLTSMCDSQGQSFAIDLESARTILSFGVPLFDGWGAPGLSSRLLDGQTSSRQQVIQVESAGSRSAMLAHQWIPLLPGYEGLFALAVAQTIVEERLVSSQTAAAISDLRQLTAFLRSFPPEAVAPSCGVSADIIRSTARTMMSAQPGVALVRDSASQPVQVQAAVHIVNLLAGAVKAQGPIVPQISEKVTPRSDQHTGSFSELADHSVDLMLLDESLNASQIPASMLEKKMRQNGLIVSFSPFVTDRPFAAHLVIPTPVGLENLTDHAGPAYLGPHTLALSVPIVPAPASVTPVIPFLQDLAHLCGITTIATGTTEEILKQRIASTHASGRGSVFSAQDQRLTEVKSLASADDLWNSLAAGGCWTGNSAASTSRLQFHTTDQLTADAPAFRILPQAEGELVMVPSGERSPFGGFAISPLMSKISQESDLRPTLGEVAMNPDTATARGLVDGSEAKIAANGRTSRVRARTDASIAPGMLLVTEYGFEVTSDKNRQPGPATPSALCLLEDERGIRPISVTIQKV